MSRLLIGFALTLPAETCEVANGVASASARSDIVRIANAVADASEPGSRSAERIARTLRLEASEVPVGLDWLEERRISVEGNAGETLSEHQRHVLVLALSMQPHSELLPVMEASLDLEGRDRLHAVVLDVIAEFGTAQHFPLLLRAAVTETLCVEQALERAVGKLLARDASVFFELKAAVLHESDFVGTTLVRATALAPCERALETLSGLLGFRTTLDLALVSQIGRVAELNRAAVTDDVRAVTRRYLRPSTEARLLREAVGTAARLEDGESVQALIELLSHDDANVRDSTLWALRRLTGLAFPADALRWERVYAEEQRWWEEEAPELLDKLGGSAPGEIAAALNSLAIHRLHRSRIAAEIEPLLFHEVDEIRRLAAHALRQLGIAPDSTD